MTYNLAVITGIVTGFTLDEMPNGKSKLVIGVETKDKFGAEAMLHSHRVVAFGSDAKYTAELIQIGRGITVIGKMRPEHGEIVADCVRVSADREGKCSQTKTY